MAVGQILDVADKEVRTADVVGRDFSGSVVRTTAIPITRALTDRFDKTPVGVGIPDESGFAGSHPLEVRLTGLSC